MGLLFLQLLNYMDKMEAGGRKFDTEIMANVYRYIEDHFKEGTLSELAVEMKVDVYWLSREIKKKSGKIYKELLQEKRMLFFTDGIFFFYANSKPKTILK